MVFFGTEMQTGGCGLCHFPLRIKLGWKYRGSDYTSKVLCICGPFLSAQILLEISHLFNSSPIQIFHMDFFGIRMLAEKIIMFDLQELRSNNQMFL